MPYGYLLVDLKPIKTNDVVSEHVFFMGSYSTCMFASKARGEHWIIIYVNDYGRYGECLARVPTRLFECYIKNIVVNRLVHNCRVLQIDFADSIVLALNS